MTTDISFVNRITLDLHEAITDLGGVECEQVPEIFFPEDFAPNTSPRIRNETIETAREICLRCPVMAKCLKVGMFEEYGIWGGSTPQQRKQIRHYEQD